MTARRIYFDYNASAPMPDAVRSSMVDALDLVGNPSSVHAEGRSAHIAINNARRQVAQSIGTSDKAIVFTSGATEAANQVLRADWSDVFVSAAEHDCIRNPAFNDNAHETALEIGINADGVINLEELDGQLQAASLLRGKSDQSWRALVCVQLANSETGVVQPMEKVVEIARAHGADVLCDCVQALGKIPLDLTALEIDYAILSAHKIGGPKGTGALFIKPGKVVPPLLAGGGQEVRQRAGTENVAGIVGFGTAAELAHNQLGEQCCIAELRDDLEARLTAATPGLAILGRNSPRLPNTTAFTVPGASAETLLIGLDMAGIAVSSGSACSSGKVGQSHVARSMGIDANLAKSILRISLGWNSSKNEVDRFTTIWAELCVRAMPQAQLAS